MFFCLQNDLPLNFVGIKFILFNDDTTVLMPCDKSGKSNTYLQACVDNIINWFMVNILVLNSTKIFAMLFILIHN